MCYFLIGALLIGGGVFASNMGFKLVYQLLTSAGGNSGTNWMAIPFNFPFANAQELYTDIPNCLEISRYYKDDDTYQTYLAGKGAINFPVTACESYLVKVSTDTNYVVVGSHDPSVGVCDLKAPTFASSGTNWISVPYHTTATNASELYDDIPNCSEISRYWVADDTYQTYLIGKGAFNFPITPGQGLLVKVSSDTSWTPSHY
jgi:hypothetical protein